MKRLSFFVAAFSCMPMIWAQHVDGTTYSDATRFSSNNKVSKLPIDSTAIKHWVRIGSYNQTAISSDGNYVSYIIQNQPHKGQTLVVQSIGSTWKREFINAEPGFFTSNSSEYIFRSKDTLFFLSVGGEKPRYSAVINSCQMSKDKSTGTATGEWLAWQLKSDPEVLMVRNLISGKEFQYSNVISYAFNQTNNTLLLKTRLKKEKCIIIGIKLIHLPFGTATDVWSSACSDLSLLSYATDKTGRQVAFILQNKKSIDGNPDNELWYYRVGISSAIKKANRQSKGIENGLFITGPPTFSNDGRYILFLLSQPVIGRPSPDHIKLDVWSYRDTLLQSAQLLRLTSNSYNAAIGTTSDVVVRLQYDYEIRMSTIVKDFAVYATNTMFNGDRFWENEENRNWLVSLKDGSRRLLEGKSNNFFYSSPSGRYLINYDNQEARYYSYDINTGRRVNISGNSRGQFAYINDFIIPRQIQNFPIGIMGWLADDAGVLVYDNTDIWKLDLRGKLAPVCITKEYGKAHHVRLRLAANVSRIYNSNDTVLLTAYDPVSKDNGFFKLILKGHGQLIPLIMGPYLYDHQGRLLIEDGPRGDDGMHPLKAARANVWILKRQSETEAPNLYITRDFKNYSPLTELNQHKYFNWLTAELITFTQKDGSFSQGILYKPENFDSTKKYPVLFNYYQQMSHRLHEYPMPNFIQHNIEIAWFVSRGYLLFTPDIYHQERWGSTGHDAYNAVVGAAEYLSKLPFVDAKRMGINGHSVGGGLTNYIITHSNLFAAAMEGAGVSDSVSAALQLSLDEGISRLGYTESLKGYSIWDLPYRYSTGSPIFKADQITTPLLIFHCKKDAAVPWEQAVELFIAMRRLGKKVWMLQYDEGTHLVFERDAEDFTIRVTQFFDHYLKGTLPPIWMTEGIPARLKGIKMGLELDHSGRQP